MLFASGGHGLCESGRPRGLWLRWPRAAVATGRMWGGGEIASQRSAVQQTLRQIKDSRTPPPVDVRWGMGASQTVGAKGTLPISVTNTGAGQRSVRVTAVSLGAGNVEAEFDLGSISLGAGQSAMINARADQLPLRSANVSTQLVVQAEYSTDDGHPVRVLAEPRFYHLSPDGQSLLVYDADTMVGQFGGGLVPGRPAAADYGLQASATTSGPGANSGAVQGPTAVALDSSQAPGDGASADAPAAVPQVPLGSGQRVCTTWKAAYEDAGFGEDYATAPGLQTMSAAYTYATVTDANQAVKWQGYLDASGCTPYLGLGYGSFTLTQKTQLSHGGASFNVYVHAFGGQWIVSLATSFSLQPTIGYITVWLSPTTQTSWTNVTAVAVQMLKATDSGIASGTYSVFSNTNCPGGNAWDSCAVGSSAYIGTLYPDGSSDSNSKIIITHEIGHTVQSVAMGIPHTDYNGDWDAPPFCNCSHIDDPQGINNLHCLQSKEYVSAAELEGFAQFMAAKAWNNPAQTDCGWAYYKPFREHLGELQWTISEPPMAKDCTIEPFAVWRPWMEENCPTNMTDHGVEWDWQTFLWLVNTQGTSGSSAATMTDIYNIYKNSAPCVGQPFMCDGQDVHWSDLDNSARA